MKATVISSKDLDTNCWSVIRFTRKCVSCAKYDTCTYPERQHDPEYDALLEAVRFKRKEADEIAKQIKAYTGA